MRLMNTSVPPFRCGLSAPVSLLAGVSCQEEYLPIEAAIEIPEAPKETLCSVKVYPDHPLVSYVHQGRSLLTVHMQTAEERLQV